VTTDPLFNPSGGNLGGEMPSESNPMSYYQTSERDVKAEGLRQRQMQDQESLSLLQRRTDYVVQPGVIGTQSQSLQRIPVGDFRRLPVGEQIVRNPDFLKRVIMPTPMPNVQRSVPINTKPYVQRIQKPPLKNTPSILYTGGMPTGMPVKKWPTSFKKAFHKPTPDESIMRGLNNLDHMSKSLLGRR
jgi:hypothetical protein